MRILADLLFLTSMAMAWAALGQTGLGTLTYPILLFLGFLVVLIHELGHAWVAYRVGARVMEIVVIPFHYNTTTRRISLSTQYPREVGGFVSLYYGQEKVGDKRFWVALAGPLANLLSIILMLLTMYWLSLETAHQPLVTCDGAHGLLPGQECIRETMASYQHRVGWREQQAFWMPYLQAFSLLSLGTALGNLLPFDGSDGLTILKEAGRARVDADPEV